MSTSRASAWATWPRWSPWKSARPADTEACRGLARALILAQLSQRALEVLAGCRGARSPQEDGENRRVAAAAYLAMGDPLGAVALLETMGAAPGTPWVSSAPALLDLGNAQEALGNDRAAELAYLRHVRLQPDSVEGNLALGRVAARQRQWSIAFPALSRARRAAPEDPRPLDQFALALQAK